MSDAVFPSFNIIERERQWAPVARTVVQTAPSGAEYRVARQVVPRWRGGFDLKLTVSDLTTFLDFWTARLGPLDSFLYTDPRGVQRRVRFDDDEPDLMEEAPGMWSVRVNLITVGLGPEQVPSALDGQELFE